MSEAQAVPSQTPSSVAAVPPAKFTDAGRVKLGSSCRLVAPRLPAQCADNGRVKIGGGCRLPNR